MTPEVLRSGEVTLNIENRERMPLKGKVALITGSSRDIGAAIAFALAKEGIQIIGNCLDKLKRAERVRMAIEQMDVQVEFVQADITIQEHRKRLEKMLDESFGGKLDYLILNTAGREKNAREVGVVANNALVDMFLPKMNKGGAIIFMQSVPGHFAQKLRGLDKIPSFYDSTAEAKYEGEQSLRAIIPELQKKGVSFIIVCPPEVSDTANMKLFERKDPLVHEKHAEISDMLKAPRAVTTEDVGEKVAELLKRKDLPMGYVELFKG